MPDLLPPSPGSFEVLERLSDPPGHPPCLSVLGAPGSNGKEYSRMDHPGSEPPASDLAVAVAHPTSGTSATLLAMCVHPSPPL